MTARRRRSGEGGFVLVCVLWIVLLVASLSALFVRSMVVHARAGSAHLRSAAAEAAADGAIRLAAFRLATQNSEASQQVAVNGSEWTCRLFEGVPAKISVQDQDGLLDLNRAPPALLGAALKAVLPADKAERALAAIVERRADSPRPGGEGEAGGWRVADEVFGPLDLLPGEGGAARFFTTYSRSDGFDPASAPAELLRLFRQSEGGGDGPLAAHVRPSRLRVFAITAEIGDRTRGRSVRRAVVDLVRAPGAPFRVLEWGTVGDAAPTPAEAGAVENPSPCLPPPR